MLAEIGAPGIWTGWLALLCMCRPRSTSSDAAMRLLRRNWKRVQRLAYPAAVLTLVHWVLVHDGMVSALVHFAPLILLQALRLARNFNPDPQPKGKLYDPPYPPDRRRARRSASPPRPPPPPAR